VSREGLTPTGGIAILYEYLLPLTTGERRLHAVYSCKRV
jgi:hypothetical protein